MAEESLAVAGHSMGTAYNIYKIISTVSMSVKYLKATVGLVWLMTLALKSTKFARCLALRPGHTLLPVACVLALIQTLS